MSRYPEAAWHPIEGASTGTYADAPDDGAVLVLHSTEGSSIAGAEAAYRAKDVVPHFTADPATGQLVQHVDTDRSASALRNAAGGVQTNRQGRVIQVELVGYAASMPELVADELRNIGRWVRMIAEREAVPLTFPAFVAYPASYGVRAPQRLAPAVWAGFTGICGHQHVPENDHGDPGALDLRRALALTEQGDPDMTPEQEKRLLDAIATVRGKVERTYNRVDERTGAIANQLTHASAELAERIGAATGGQLTAAQRDELAADLAATITDALVAPLTERLGDELAARLAQ